MTKLIASPSTRAAAAKLGLTVTPVVSENSETAQTAIAREERRAAYRDELARQFPAVFARPDVPLAVGIRHQLRAALPHGRKTRDAVLHQWTRTPDYLKAIAAGAQRRNLDGSPAGYPTADERAHAAERLHAMESLDDRRCFGIDDVLRPEADDDAEA